MKPNFMAIHRSTSRAETSMTQKEEEEEVKLIYQAVDFWTNWHYGLYIYSM